MVEESGNARIRKGERMKDLTVSEYLELFEKNFPELSFSHDGTHYSVESRGKNILTHVDPVVIAYAASTTTYYNHSASTIGNRKKIVVEVD
jgi:hypothetical protein